MIRTICVHLVAVINLCPLIAADTPTEYEVKAAFIYNFAKFIEWPDLPSISSDSVFVIGIIGEDPFGTVFEETIGQNQVQGKQIVIRRFKNLDELIPVHILFISQSEKSRTHRILNILLDVPVLTVGEFEGFLESEGIIYLFLEGNRVRFMVNRKAAEDKKLDISAKLLNLAKNH